jgi:Gamma-glutamyl cyclotransferase, AIG2-like
MKEPSPPKKEPSWPKKESSQPEKESPPPTREPSPPTKERTQPMREPSSPKKEHSPPRKEPSPPKRERLPPKKEPSPPKTERLPPTPPKQDRPSPMTRKFLQAQGRTWQPDLDAAPDPFRREYYFFYGSLADPHTLATVLKRRGPPRLLPAKIFGYSCMLWGQYPALLDGPPGAPVSGMAYEVQTPSDKKPSEIYETSNYKLRPCLIKFQDGREVDDSAFLWNADKAHLREGTFNLRDWQMDKMERASIA